MKHSMTALALLGGLLWHGAASADVSGQARMGNIGFTLIDLDPNDGITPALTMTHVGTRYENDYGYISASTPSGNYWEQFYPPATPQPWEYSYNLNNVETAHVAVLGRDDSWKQSVEGEAHIVTSLSESRGLNTSIEGDQAHFTLTPNTAVAFYSTVQIEASVTPPQQRQDWFDIFALFWLAIEDPKQPDGLLGVDLDLQDFRLESARGFSETRDSLDLVQTSWLNRTDQQQAGWVSMEMWMYAGSGTLDPVPEPAHYAMLLAGLALVGWTARQRRS